jgi:hypothetical protein
MPPSSSSVDRRTPEALSTSRGKPAGVSDAEARRQVRHDACWRLAVAFGEQRTCATYRVRNPSCRHRRPCDPPQRPRQRSFYGLGRKKLARSGPSGSGLLTGIAFRNRKYFRTNCPSRACYFVENTSEINAVASRVSRWCPNQRSRTSGAEHSVPVPYKRCEIPQSAVRREGHARWFLNRNHGAAKEKRHPAAAAGPARGILRRVADPIEPPQLRR